MAIKDRDGNIYKLRGPNPLLETQEEWDKKKLSFYNLAGVRHEEIVEDERNPVEEFKANVVDIGKELKLKTIEPKPQPRAKVIAPQKFIEGLSEPDPVPIQAIKVDPIPEVPTINVDERMARLLKERGAEYYYAPAVGKKTHTDDFYGQSYTTVEYGHKDIVDAVVIDQSDLELQFWCVKEVPVQSIVYRKVKQGGERWWRVNQIESKTGGWLVKCIVSDTNPDFS